MILMFFELSQAKFLCGKIEKSMSVAVKKNINRILLYVCIQMVCSQMPLDYYAYVNNSYEHRLHSAFFYYGYEYLFKIFILSGHSKFNLLHITIYTYITHVSDVQIDGQQGVHLVYALNHIIWQPYYQGCYYKTKQSTSRYLTFVIDCITRFQYLSFIKEFFLKPSTYLFFKHKQLRRKIITSH